MRNYFRKLLEILEIKSNADFPIPRRATVPPLDEVSFWYVINRCNNLSGTNERYYNELWSILNEMDAATLVGFGVKVDQLRSPLNDWNTWAAAKFLFPEMPFAAFHGFQNWIISSGKEAFLKVSEDRDNIADAIHIGGQRDLVFENFDRVPAEVLSQRPEAEHYSLLFDRNATELTLKGDHWAISEENLLRRYPRLASLVNQKPNSTDKQTAPTLH